MKEKEHKALIVDDEKSIRKTLSLFLKDEGYKTYSTGLPSEAVKILHEEKFDLALIDVNLPEMDGLCLAEILLKKDPELAVIFITGMDSFDNMRKAIRLGANDYLKKPLLPGELNLVLKRFEDRRELREKVLQVERLNTMLIQNIPVILMTINNDLNITSANNASINMLGYSPMECTVPGWLISRVTENDRIKLNNAILDSRKKENPLSVIIKMKHRNDCFVYTLFQSLPKFPDDPEKNGLRCAVTDITDRVLLEKKMILDEKLKTMGAITAEVAHEIRNPLMSIGGFARRLQDRFPNLAEAEIIVRESYRLEKILNRINNYLSPIKFEKVECNAVEILKECLELLEPQLFDSKVRCSPVFSENLPTVHADPDLLRQVFINIILGCTKNIEPENRLEIRAEEKNNFLEIRFSTADAENNIIDPEKIFTPFEDGGMSIGIPLTYRLIKKMDGELNFLTEESNAVFLINIPVCNDCAPTCTDEEKRPDSCIPINPSGDLDTLLQREWLRSAREMKPIGVVTLEIEDSDFISVNDTDNACVETYTKVCEILQETLKRAGDFLSSVGPRTFVGVLPGTDEEGASTVAEQMKIKAKEKMAEIYSVPVDKIVVITGTAVEIPNPEHIPDELVDRALKDMRDSGNT